MRASHGRLARAGLALVFAAGGVLGAASPAFATDCASLQTALTNATTGSTVTLDEGSVCTGPYTLPNTSITLHGGGTGATIQGTAGARAISGVDVGTTTLSNLTIQNGGGTGNGGAVVITGNSSPTFDNDSFMANATTGSGGALFVNSTTASGTISITNSTFGDGTIPNRNHSTGSGGAIAITSAIPVVVSGSTFKGNAADDVGGGALAVVLNAATSLTVNTTVFEGNDLGGSAADLGGGALRVDAAAGSTTNLNGNTFQDNSIVAANNAPVANGGGAYLSYPSLVTPPSAVSKNNLFQGNAISGGSSSSFSPNGGALALNQVVLNSNTDRFIKNQLAPGIGWYPRGSAVSLGTCVSSGPAPQDVLTQAVVAGNVVPAPSVGAVGSSCTQLLLAETALRIRQSTIAGNEAAGFAAGVWGGPNSTITLENSILASNTGGADLSGFKTQTVAYSNVCVGNSPPIPPPGDGNVCADPRLADPADADIFQTASSPTVDAGSNSLASGISSDYAGQSRIVDGDQNGTATVDIGADERRQTTTCARLPDEFARAADGAVMHLAAGQICTGSYTLPAARISLIGDGGGVTFQPSSGRSLYGKDVGSTLFKNLTFTGGSGAPGGAVFIEGASTPTFDTVNFLDNHSTGDGGALALYSSGGSGTITIQDSHFGDDTPQGSNSGARGGAAAIFPGPSNLFITRSTFDKNQATDGAGGGLYLDRGSGVRDFKRVDFIHNSVTPQAGVDGRGGGAYVGANSGGTRPITLAGVLFEENTIDAGSGVLAGAGLFVFGLLPTEQISQNYNIFRRNTFADATSASKVMGAGEAVQDATVSFHEDQYLHNSIGPHGSADASGVALALDGCSSEFPGTTQLLFNDVFAHNTAPDGANGTISVSCSATSVTLRVINSTIVANDIPGTAGVWGADDEALVLGNAILSGNATGADIGGFASRDVTFSDICAGGGPHPGAGNICGDPLLVDVANDDVHQTAASPTVDAGSNDLVPNGFRYDYEGHDRIIDSDKNGTATADIGADEMPVPGPPPIPLPPALPPVVFTPSGPGVTPVIPPAQVVADVKASGGTPAKPAAPKKKKRCGDNTGPTSRFLNRLSSAARFRGPQTLTIRGKARYKKCTASDKGKIKRVNFSIHLVQGKTCRWLTKARSLGPPQSCRRKRFYLKAKGTTNWSFVVKGPMPAGKYLADVQAVDNLGNKERPGRHRNFRHFRINGLKLRQGWTGSHPEDYTVRG